MEQLSPINKPSKQKKTREKQEPKQLLSEGKRFDIIQIFSHTQGNKFGQAAERRRKQQNARNQQKPTASLSQSPQKISESKQEESKKSNAPVEIASKSAIAEAAQKRQADAAQKSGLSEEKAKELRTKRAKDELLGKISHYYVQMGKDAPFGLASANLETLKRHLDYVKTQTSK